MPARSYGYVDRSRVASLLSRIRGLQFRLATRDPRPFHTNRHQAQARGGPLRLQRAEKRNEEVEQTRLPRGQVPPAEHFGIQPPAEFPGQVLVRDLDHLEPGRFHLLDEIIFLVT